MVMAEWAGFEISSIVLGTISETELAVNGIIVSYMSITFMVMIIKCAILFYHS